MTPENILSLFEQKPPRRVCFKNAAPDEGVGFHPLSVLSELIPGGGLIMVVLVLIGLGTGSLWVAAIVACILVGLALLGTMEPLTESFSHKQLAQYGLATVGTVIAVEFVDENDDTPAPPTRFVVKYEFHTLSGQRLTGKRDTISGWFTALEEQGPVVIVYLAKRPEVHEPYNSLRYRIGE